MVSQEGRVWKKGIQKNRHRILQEGNRSRGEISVVVLAPGGKGRREEGGP